MILNDLNKYFSSDFHDELWRTGEEFHFDELEKNEKSVCTSLEYFYCMLLSSLLHFRGKY